MKDRERLEAAWKRREARWDRTEFLVQLVLFVLGLFLLLRIEFLDEISSTDVTYHEIGVRHALPPPEVQ